MNLDILMIQKDLTLRELEHFSDGKRKTKAIPLSHHKTLYRWRVGWIRESYPPKERNDPGLNDNPIGRNNNPPIDCVIDDRDKPIQEHVVPILEDLNAGIIRPLNLIMKHMRFWKRLPTIIINILPQELTDHVFDECLSNPASMYYMGNFNQNNNPYSNTYNPRWKQHPNFSWNNQGVGNKQCCKIECQQCTASGTQLDDVAQDAMIGEDNSNNNHVKIPKPSEKYTVVEKGKQKIVAAELDRKRRLGEFETIALTVGYTTMLMNKLNRVSINLMSMSIFRKLGIGKARPTTVTLQLANRSYAHLKGKIEDVLVRVDKFNFSADFLILKCEANKDVSIILGRPFLTISRTLIDMQKGELTMRNEEFHTTGLIETTVEEEFTRFCHSNSDSAKESLEWSNAIIFPNDHYYGAHVDRDKQSIDLRDNNFTKPMPEFQAFPTSLLLILEAIKEPAQTPTARIKSMI
ncbi:hypothetical protein Gotur_010071 [Gossypium turneri]